VLFRSENQGTRTDLSQKSVKGIDTQKEAAALAGVSHDTGRRFYVEAYTEKPLDRRRGLDRFWVSD
jgi:hypothetical protein